MKKLFTLLLITTLSSAYLHAQTGGLVINEVDYDQPSVDSAEFIELYNAGSASINLGDYTVVLFNGNATSNVIYDSFPLPAQLLSAGDYFVICGAAGKIPNCDMTLTAYSNIIQNGSPDAIALRENQTLNIVDVVSYEGTCIAPYASGAGVPLLQSDTLQTDSIAGRYLGISRFPDGNDTNDDSTDFNRVCITPGAANTNNSSNCVTGLSTPKASIAVAIYPNPSRGIVNVDFKSTGSREVRVRVCDILGNELKNVLLKSAGKQGSLDLSEFPNGIYLIKVESAGGQIVKRVILNR